MLLSPGTGWGGAGAEAVSETDGGGSYAGLGRGAVSAAEGAASGGVHVDSLFTADCHMCVFIWAGAGEGYVCVGVCVSL